MEHIIPPTKPGQTGYYYCKNCGHRFLKKIPVISLFPIRCPICGSFKVTSDPAIVH